MTSLLDRGLSALAGALRLGSGGRVRAPGRRPEQTLVLYEFEGCPFCRKVREALSTLDLDASIRPCPKRGTRFRPELVERGGKAQFPYLVDADAGVELYESDAIVRHLFERYGDGTVPAALAAGPLTDAGAVLVGLLRRGAGSFARPSRAPTTPLLLYGYEAAAACRPVRERLSVLEIPYLLHNRAPGSRRALPPGVSPGELPHLVDPDRAEAVSGTEPVLEYLEAHYAV